MFLQQPHTTTRSYKDLSARIGRDIFVDTDNFEPYYVSWFALYKLNSAYATRTIDPIYKIGRYQILLVARFLMDQDALPRMNSHDMERRCNVMMERLWREADEVLGAATRRFHEIVDGNLDRDYIHSQPVTAAILEAFGQRRSGG
jgi:hypothetical protein